MRRFAALLLLALTACGLRPLYGGASGDAITGLLRSVEVDPIEGHSGWLVRNKLRDRLADAMRAPAPTA